MNWLHSGEKKEVGLKRESQCGWCFFFWLSVTLLLSLKLEFIFYKLEWNVFVFQVIISILLGDRLHLMKWAHQSVCCANEAALAGWLAGWRAGSLALTFCCKAPAEVTGSQQRAPLHKRVVSAVVERSQDNGAKRWPGPLVTCQLVSKTHKSWRARGSTIGRA